ncbi:MAG: phosphoglycolate phosphatase [Magnetococcales bacterium]|nr:phosphoglycolate phosphatase [Magnetococcales bacterium]
MAQTPSPQAALFDLDGTLVDTSPDLWGALNHVLEKRGYPLLQHHEVRHLVGNGARVLCARGFWGEESEPPEGDPDFEAAVQDFLAYYRDHLTDHSRPYPGVVETLTKLQKAGIAQAVVTNKPEDLSVRLLDELNLSRFFSTVIGGNTLPRRKPDPDPIFHALKQLNATPAQGVMVGDSDTDAKAAQAAQCPLILVTYGYNRGLPVAEMNPDLVVDRFDEINAFFSF